MARKKLVAGNWKMNTTLAEAKALAAGVAKGVGAASAVGVARVPAVPVADGGGRSHQRLVGRARRARRFF